VPAFGVGSRTSLALILAALPGVQSPMSKENHYWFRAKRYGLGWGLPCSWQGWTFFLIWLAVLVIAATELMPGQPLIFTLTLAGMALILVVACYIKGEPLSGGSKKTE
jgi:hypothetical protein